MSLAFVCKQVAVLVGVTPFSAWAANDDPGAVELVAWVNEAQRRIADEWDWPQLAGSLHQAVTGSPVHVVTPGVLVARWLPDTAWLDEWPVEGPLGEREWNRRLQYLDAGAVGRSGEADFRPGFTVRDGAVALVSCPVGKVFSIGYVQACPDLATDADVSVLESGSAWLNPGAFSRLLALCTVMLYRDAKGLPAGSAAAQYLSALASLKGAAVPIGGLKLARRGSGRGRGPGMIATEPGTVIYDGGGTYA